MAWDKSLPSNSEKIRNLGIVIRPNWEAIEEGDDVGTSSMLQQRSVQLDNRTGLAANNDPQTNTGTHYLYSKDDGGGTQEAFMKDSAGNVVQLTDGGVLGGATTGINLSNFSYTANMLPTALAYVPDTGTTFTRQINCSAVTRPATGSYSVVTDAVFNNANVYVTIVPLIVAGNATTAQLGSTPTLAGGKITTSVRIRNNNGNDINAGFMLVIFGGIA